MFARHQTVPFLGVVGYYYNNDYDYKFVWTALLSVFGPSTSYRAQLVVVSMAYVVFCAHRRGIEDPSKGHRMVIESTVEVIESVLSCP